MFLCVFFCFALDLRFFTSFASFFFPVVFVFFFLCPFFLFLCLVLLLVLHSVCFVSFLRVFLQTFFFLWVSIDPEHSSHLHRFLRLARLPKGHWEPLARDSRRRKAEKMQMCIFQVGSIGSSSSFFVVFHRSFAPRSFLKPSFSLKKPRFWEARMPPRLRTSIRPSPEKKRGRKQRVGSFSQEAGGPNPWVLWWIFLGMDFCRKRIPGQKTREVKARGGQVPCKCRRPVEENWFAQLLGAKAWVGESQGLLLEPGDFRFHSSLESRI